MTDGANAAGDSIILNSFLFRVVQLLNDIRGSYHLNAELYRVTNASDDSLADYHMAVNAELTACANACLEVHHSWHKEILDRVELVFGRPVKIEEAITSPRLPRKTWSAYECTEEEKASLLLRLLVLSIPEYGYDARMCHVLDELHRVMGMDRDTFIRAVESQLGAQIRGGYLDEQQNIGAQRTKNNQLKKRLLMGVGALLGGVAVGVTAGMAAPAVIPLLAPLIGISAGTTFLVGSTGATIFAVLFGAGGAGLAGYKVSRRYRSISTFRFLPIGRKDENLRVSLGISGWIREDEDLYTPWLGLGTAGVDLYALDCERQAFKDLGNAIGDFVTKSAVGYATMEVVKTTAMSTAVAALIWPIAILQASSLIDNPWSVCMNIAQKAGLILADAIRNHSHGHRPLTLAGFSLGALVIFECLKELSFCETSQHLGVVENVILFGLPAEICPLERWCKMRMLVAGRFIHCYSKGDWVLRFLFRATSLAVGNIAGLNPIEGVMGIENVNMSDFVKGHLEYAEKIPDMLQLFNI